MPAKTTKRKSPRKQPLAILSEEDRTFVHLSIKLGPEKAAAHLGWKPEQVEGLMRIKAFRDYLKRYEAQFLKTMASWEVTQVTKFPVGRGDVLGRLIALALLPPEDTKGTIDGQVEALNAISEILGLKFSPRDADAYFKDKTPDQIKNYALHGKWDLTEEEKKAADAEPAKSDGADSN
ncbi:MAG TPA: hypothetical protein VGG42_09775 [Acidobacteriaceae bacterium]|jgi:hypothetical protein